MSFNLQIMPNGGKKRIIKKMLIAKAVSAYMNKIEYIISFQLFPQFADIFFIPKCPTLSLSWDAVSRKKIPIE